MRLKIYKYSVVNFVAIRAVTSSKIWFELT